MRKSKHDVAALAEACEGPEQRDYLLWVEAIRFGAFGQHAEANLIYATLYRHWPK